MQTSYAIPNNTNTFIGMTGMAGIGAYIRGLRTGRGMTQRALSEASAVDRSYLAQIEGGRIALPGADIRRRLALALGVSHLDLLIAAGEITPEEIQATGSEGVIDDDPVVAELVELVRGINWQPDKLGYARAILNQMKG